MKNLFNGKGGKCIIKTPFNVDDVGFEEQMEFLNSLSHNFKIEEEKEIYIKKIKLITEGTKFINNFRNEFNHYDKLYKDALEEYKVIMNEYFVKQINSWLEEIGIINFINDKNLYFEFVLYIELIKDLDMFLKIDNTKYLKLGYELINNGGDLEYGRSYKYTDVSLPRITNMTVNDRYTINKKELGNQIIDFIKKINQYREKMEFILKEKTFLYKNLNDYSKRVDKFRLNENVNTDLSDEVENVLLRIDLLNISIFDKDILKISYFGDFSTIIDITNLKFPSVVEILGIEKYNEIKLKSLKKFNKIFIKNINDLLELQDKYYQGELITSIFFDELKDSGLGLNDLGKIGINIDNINTKSLDNNGKEKLLNEFMKMYEYSYEGKIKFLLDIKKGLNKSIEDEKMESYFLKYEGKNILSFYTEQKDDHIYLGGLNAGEDLEYYNMGIWYVKQRVKELGKDNDLECVVSNIIEGNINEDAKGLLILYKRMGFKEVEGENLDGKITRLRREKDNK